jgi:hypothetical protein
MLVLPIKKKWYDMILSGEKKEEYRELKVYYKTRLCTEGLIIRDGVNKDGVPSDNKAWVLFRNGYSGDSPCFKALCSAAIGRGNPKWGAEPGKSYYVLKISEIEA